jgi:guanylate kinase
VPNNALLVVISGPSGVGKDAILSRMTESGCPIERITTMTTRSRRAAERNNIDYRFVTAERFQSMVEKGELLEWAKVYGNWYGIPKEDIKSVLESGQDAIIKVDVQGATTLKKIIPQAVFVFVVAPSIEELVSRLKERKTESPAELALRLKVASEEMKQLNLFDYVVVNKPGGVDEAIANIKAIIAAEKCRIPPRRVVLPQ